MQSVSKYFMVYCPETWFSMTAASSSSNPPRLHSNSLEAVARSAGGLLMILQNRHGVAEKVAGAGHMFPTLPEVRIHRGFMMECRRVNEWSNAVLLKLFHL